MQKIILTGAGCLIIGFFTGFFVSNHLNRTANLPTADLPPNHPESSLPTQQTVSIKEPTGAALSEVNDTIEKARKTPENFDAQIKAGTLYQQIQRSDKALEFFNNAAALKPTDYEKIVRLGNAFFDIREFQKAEIYYLQALEKKPDDLGVRTDLGITFVERQNPDYDRAVREFQTSLAVNPKHEPTLYNLAIAYFKKGDSENARKFAGQLAQNNPNSPLVGRLNQLISQN